MKRKNVTVEEFFKVYNGMAKQGKSALEIARAIGHEGADDKAAQFVSVKASQLRTAIKKDAEKEGVKLGLSGDALTTFIDKCVDKVPTLGGRGRKKRAKSLLSVVDAILAEVDGVAAETPADNVAESPAEEIVIAAKPKRGKAN
jgi:hypothetical protein